MARPRLGLSLRWTVESTPPGRTPGWCCKAWRRASRSLTPISDPGTGLRAAWALPAPAGHRSSCRVTFQSFRLPALHANGEAEGHAGISGDEQLEIRSALRPGGSLPIRRRAFWAGGLVKHHRGGLMTLYSLQTAGDLSCWKCSFSSYPGLTGSALSRRSLTSALDFLLVKVLKDSRLRRRPPWSCPGY